MFPCEESPPRVAELGELGQGLSFLSTVGQRATGIYTIKLYHHIPLMSRTGLAD